MAFVSHVCCSMSKITAENLTAEQIHAAYQAGKIEWQTHHVALLDASLASGSDVDAIVFARRVTAAVVNRLSTKPASR